MPRTLPRLLTPFRVQRPELLPTDAAQAAAARPAPVAQSASSAQPACRGLAAVPPCGRSTCVPASCGAAGGAASLA
jgi:hypothetical protein